MKTPIAVFILAGSLSVAVEAKDDEDSSPAACPALQAQTVFVSDKTGSRKRGSAERLSETHQNAEARGWNFEDLEVYIEDGDLEGFFVTYTRPHPCNAAE